MSFKSVLWPRLGWVERMLRRPTLPGLSSYAAEKTPANPEQPWNKSPLPRHWREISWGATKTMAAKKTLLRVLGRGFIWSDMIRTRRGPETSRALGKPSRSTRRRSPIGTARFVWISLSNKPRLAKSPKSESGPDRKKTNSSKPIYSSAWLKDFTGIAALWTGGESGCIGRNCVKQRSRGVDGHCSSAGRAATGLVVGLNVVPCRNR